MRDGMGEFRGKRVDNGEWVYGYLVIHPGSAFILETGYPVENGDFYAPPKWWAHVDQNTIGQFTGLHDKNGKEIYEGDILRISGYSKAGYNTGVVCFTVEVKWERMCWSCGAKSLYNYSTIDWASIEVIGNIHDNPELKEVHHV